MDSDLEVVRHATSRPERFNAKARRSSSTASSHKRGKQRRLKRHSITDTNPEILLRKSAEEKELDRREQLKKELLSQSQSKVSSKKRKRLDKYIEKKLKKEERVELFEKLAKSQADLQSIVQLQPSSTLGFGRDLTAQERLEKTEDKEVRRAIYSRQRRGGHLSDIRESSGDDEVVDDAQDVDPEVDIIQDDEDTSAQDQVVVVDSASTATRKQDVQADIVVGGALQRNADGSIAKPRIMKKKSTGTILRRWKRAPPTTLPTSVDGNSESSFDSSDSADDTSEAESETTNSNMSERPEDGISEPESGMLDDESPQDAGTGLSTPPRRSVGFKQWAVTQLSTVKDYVAPIYKPSPQPRPEEDRLQELSRPNKKRKINPSSPMEMRGPLGEDITLPSTSFTEHLKHTPCTEARRKVVAVTRLPKVDDARLLLPIVAEEQPIMEAILLNPVVVICGETGSGKTTQVPQFLFEAGFGSPESDNPGMIGITQPRRVAAMSMASRVAHELSLPSSRVSYQIRYDATVSPSTSIKFMTDGVLLRELASDFLLSKYSVLIIDEAHERSMNTDILIGVVSRVVKLRESMWREGNDSIKPLRLVIMSATLRVSDFVENATLFATPPPVIKVPARQYPVTIHFNRRSSSDYVNDAIRKASKIHARLPPGGILIFLTGQNEISGVCRRLEEKYSAKNIAEWKKRRQGVQASLDTQRFFRNDGDTITINPSQVEFEAEEIDLGDAPEDDPALDVEGQPSDKKDTDMDALDTDDEAEDQALGIDSEESDVPMHIIPLYSLLPTDKQMKVFEPPPAGARLVVVATNVAETSLTIPGIRYVIDCGRAKERRYNLANGIQSFRISWISKASAAQRAGRAGRTGPGHCYRLYSSAVFENYFEEFSQPEILRVPIEGVVLQMKSMHIDAVTNFPFPTPPDRQSLRQAEKMLTYLGALEGPPITAPFSAAGGTVTDIGRTMSLFPLSPRFSKMLVSSRRHGCMPYAIAIVSAISVGDPFLREETLGIDDQDSSESETEGMAYMNKETVRAKELSKQRRRAYFVSQQYHASLGKSTGDLFRILSVVGAYEYAGGGQSFCAEHFVRPKAMEEIHKLRAQISNIVHTNFPDADAGFTSKLPPPRDIQLRVLRQLIASCFIDHVAVRKELVEKGSATGVQRTTARGVPYRTIGISDDVYIHPSSVLATTSPPPDYVVYHEVVRTSQVWLKGLTLINPAWLPSLGKPLCTFSKPFKNKAGDMMVTPKFGPDGWELPPVKADNH